AGRGAATGQDPGGPDDGPLYRPVVDGPDGGAPSPRDTAPRPAPGRDALLDLDLSAHRAPARIPSVRAARASGRTRRRTPRPARGPRGWGARRRGGRRC